MCMIIYKPIGIGLPSENVLFDCFYSNRDGAGYMYMMNNKLFIDKGIFSPGKLYEKLLNIEKVEQTQLAIHFRLATHGEINAQNCHPFLVSDTSAIMHNGILSKKYSYNPDISDSFLFSQQLIKHEKNFLRKNCLKRYIEHETIGSRILYFNAEKNMVIMTGTWHKFKGLYFSNYYSGEYFYHKNICPYCNGELKNISKINDLYECENCGLLLDGYGQEVDIVRVSY